MPGIPTADADGSETGDVPFGALEHSVGIRDWLLGEGARIDKAERMLEGLAERLIEIGVPIDRASTAIDTLHSEYAGVGRVWTRNSGVTVRLFPHGSRSQDAYCCPVAADCGGIRSLSTPSTPRCKDVAVRVGQPSDPVSLCKPGA